MSNTVNVSGLVLPELPEGHRFAMRHVEPDVWPAFPVGVTLRIEIQTPYKMLWKELWSWDGSMPRYDIDLREGIDHVNRVIARMAEEAQAILDARALTSA